MAVNGPHDEDDELNDDQKLKKRSTRTHSRGRRHGCGTFCRIGSLSRREFATSQRMMRLRVLAQSATIGTMVATSGVAMHDLGGGFFATKKTKDDAE